MLTPKQQKVFDTITEYIHKFGESPTLEELQKTLGIQNKRSIVQFLEYLDEKGYIRRTGGYRGIRLGDRLVASQMAIPIPILGVVNAGRPLSYADESQNGFLHVSKTLIKGDEKKYFCVKVDGTSMNKFTINGKNIDDGSFVLVNNSYDWASDKNGAYVCIVNGCATVKKIKKEGDETYLIPESNDSAHKPIILSSDDVVEINGKVVDVFNFE
ncbi:MAG: S24 family peptidase [Candidatus Gracilibacteria bacterium]|nr:S24 family peptidase [Candidatus Gracilibacteria bacterium]